ncbi:GNAT family N-acetyltransferase [Actinopolymorpha sp. NPDC004070]|uniref:GNAT family N-acetyltransferase n=1 Tax=Actinopolymorpha sp. NPDC004070 TaxID=3154548 RepID=UPI0033AE1501
MRTSRTCARNIRTGRSPTWRSATSRRRRNGSPDRRSAATPSARWYVDGEPAGWVNASRRTECSMYRLGDDADPPDGDVISLSCFGIAPPYRGHGLVTALLRRVLADAPARGMTWVEAYPFANQENVDEDNWRGPRSLYDTHRFELVEQREHYSVMRRGIARRRGSWRASG